MEVPKWCPRLFLIFVEVHVAYLLPFPAKHVALFRACCLLRKCLFHAPCDKHSGRVGQALDAGAYFGDLGRGFEDGYGVAREEGGYGGAEATEACAYNYDLGLCVRMGEVDRWNGEVRGTYMELALRISVLFL